MVILKGHCPNVPGSKGVHVSVTLKQLTNWFPKTLLPAIPAVTVRYKRFLILPEVPKALRAYNNSQKVFGRVSGNGEEPAPVAIKDSFLFSAPNSENIGNRCFKEKPGASGVQTVHRLW